MPTEAVTVCLWPIQDPRSTNPHTDWKAGHEVCTLAEELLMVVGRGRVSFLQ